METLIEFIKEFLIPGSIPFLLVGLLIGMVLLYRRGASDRWGRRWLTFLLAFYWLLSTPFLALSLEHLLGRGYGSLDAYTPIEEIQAVIVLGGGSDTYRVGAREVNVLSEASILRAMEGSRLYFALEDPWVIVSGGTNERARMLTPESEPLRDLLISADVPSERILLESTSGNTYEQALNLKPLLERVGVERFVLVTSPSHMRRSMATFQAEGLSPIPSTSAQHPDGFLEGFSPLLPNHDALHTSRMVFREIMALVYYALSGRF